MYQINDPVTAIPGIGPKKAALFEKLGIRTFYDLLCFFPRTYEDRLTLTRISSLCAYEPRCFEAMVISQPKTHLIRKGLELTQVTVADSTGKLRLTFFNQKYTAGKLSYGESYIFYGALNPEYGSGSMTNPTFEAVGSAGSTTQCILPVYPLTAGLTNRQILNTVRISIDSCLNSLPEFLPPSVIRQFSLCSVQEAYRKIHMPQSMDDIAFAKKRLIFEEYFLFSLGLSLSRERRSSFRREPFRDLSLSEFYQVLPFTPTGAQQRAIAEIISDFSRPLPMNRMLQGDVGSGKTAVCAAAIAVCCRNGEQAVLMVPTEVLAEQHYQSLAPMFEKLGLHTALLTGSTSAAARKQLLPQIASGECNVVIGTHALFSKNVEYRSLGLVVTDEQHRFGVGQRDAMQQKGEHPHLLVMSATPIPRTLALILYGDLDVSVLDEKPANRKEIQTFLVNEGMRARINAFIRKQAAEGHQIFVICPAVEDSEDGNMKSVELWAETLQQAVFPDLRVALVHGQMNREQKDAAMLAFSRHEADILVATTVIEVGIDIPNATLIVIENADRFGLSQLHQLRGRVGRSDLQSYCILFSDNRNEETLQRLRSLCKTTDGFRIAEEDLSQRGPGDFFGSRQSGLPIFRTADMVSDLDVLTEAKKAADRYLENPEDYAGSTLLRERITRFFDQTSESLN